MPGGSAGRPGDALGDLCVSSKVFSFMILDEEIKRRFLLLMESLMLMASLQSA